MKLDLYTIISMYMFVNYICAFIVGITWYRIRNKYEGILLIFIDFILQSFALTLSSFQ